MSKIEEQIWAMAEPIAEAGGLELVDVEFVKEGSEWFLRVFIDKDADGGVGLEDCELVSRRLSELLDQKDPITQQYRLEVSSPGIERPLKKDGDFVRFEGEKVRVKLFSPLNGQKEFVGLLGKTTTEAVVLYIDDQALAVPRAQISKVNLVWEF